MANILFLLLPIAGNNETSDPERSYLKTYEEMGVRNVANLIADIAKELSHIDYEDFSLICDQRRIKALTVIGREEYPRPTHLLKTFDKYGLKSYQESKIPLQPLTINGQEVNDGILNAFVTKGTKHDTTLDPDTLSCDHRSLTLSDATGKVVDVAPLKCNADELYDWFVANRHPQRQYDDNYAKHGKQAKSGRKGTVNSPMPYTAEEAQTLLTRAVGTRKSDKLYVMDKSRKKLVVFSDENLAQQPTYHGHEEPLENNIALNNPELRARIEKHCVC